MVGCGPSQRKRLEAEALKQNRQKEVSSAYIHWEPQPGRGIIFACMNPTEAWKRGESEQGPCDPAGPKPLPIFFFPGASVSSIAQ